MNGAGKTGRVIAIVVGLTILAGACSGGSSDGDAAPAAASSHPAGSAVPSTAGQSPAGSAAPTRNSGPPAGGNPAAAQVDGKDADAVSKAAALTMCLVDTDTDISDYDAMLRTAPLLDRDYLARLRAEQPRPVEGGDWAEMAGHHAYTTATAHLSPEMGQPPDNTLEAYRGWIVDVTTQGRDGWRGEPQTVVVFVFLRRDSADQPWRIVELRQG